MIFLVLSDKKNYTVLSVTYKRKKVDVRVGKQTHIVWI